MYCIFFITFLLSFYVYFELYALLHYIMLVTIIENSQWQCQQDIEAVRNVVEGKLDTAISSLMNTSKMLCE